MIPGSPAGRRATQNGGALFPDPAILYPQSSILIFHTGLHPIRNISKSVTYGRFDAIFILTLFLPRFRSKMKNAAFTKRLSLLIKTGIF
jgi:hypothetical protein